LFVDVGASLGQYTFFANQIMRDGLIVAVEADPIRVLRLQENAAKWQKESPRNEIRVVHAALSDAAGTTTFYTTKSNTSGSVARDQIPVSGDKAIKTEAIQVPALTLDSLLGDRQSGLVKVDVEGGEYRVLQGSERTLRSNGFDWLMEVHSWGDAERSTSPADVYALMKASGYGRASLHSHDFFFPSRGAFSMPKAFVRRLRIRWLRRMTR
jgi:FkbM family methyltransferase